MMETLIGFTIGFVLGTHEGKQGLVRLRESWEAIRDSTDFKQIVGDATVALGPIVRDLAKHDAGSS